MKPAWLIIIVFILSLGSCKFENKDNAGESAVNDSIKTTLDALNKQIAGNASDPELYNKRASFYLLDHEFDKAFKDINRAISLSPSDPVYYITLSDIYLLQGQTKNCAESLAKAISHQHHPASWCPLSRAWRTLSRARMSLRTGCLRTCDSGPCCLRRSPAWSARPAASRQ